MHLLPHESAAASADPVGGVLASAFRRRWAEAAVGDSTPLRRPSSTVVQARIQPTGALLRHWNDGLRASAWYGGMAVSRASAAAAGIAGGDERSSLVQSTSLNTEFWLLPGPSQVPHATRRRPRRPAPRMPNGARSRCYGGPGCTTIRSSRSIAAASTQPSGLGDAEIPVIWRRHTRVCQPGGSGRACLSCILGREAFPRRWRTRG